MDILDRLLNEREYRQRYEIPVITVMRPSVLSLSRNAGRLFPHRDLIDDEQKTKKIVFFLHGDLKKRKDSTILLERG